ncbi:hypothetical protein L208DRAFT_61270 [Tricholoma matsutake]|nr:hypothetical protein L208DRAFT_61270 [Tricholoma matsutake 945]
MHKDKPNNIEIDQSLTFPMNDATLFPPDPVDAILSCCVVCNFCKESSPGLLQEAGCVVCGQLTPVSLLTRLKAVKNLLHVLQASGVTRVEHKKVLDPVCEFKGPLLDYIIQVQPNLQ